MMENPNKPQEQPTDTTRTPLELLYRVSHELATALDLPAVFQKVLSLSIETIGAFSGSMIILDDQGKPVDSAIIYGGRVIHHTTQQLQATLEQGLAGWVVRNQQAALVSDTRTDERWLHRPDDDESASGAKSVVAVPILARDRLVGVATFSHHEPNVLNEQHLDLAQAIADQAGVAVLNARLYEESKRQARVMTALAKSARAMTSSIQLDSVLNNILHQIKDALQVEAVTLALLDEENQEVEYRAAIYKNYPARPDILGKRIPLGKGVVGWVAQHGKRTVIPDISKDPRFDPDYNIHPDFIPQAIASAPIRLRRKVIGVLEAINPENGEFGSDALLVLTGIGSLAGSSIQNAQLFEELQAAHNRYHTLFENSIDPIVITDLQGHILEANQPTIHMSQYALDRILSMHIWDLHEMNPENTGDNFSLTIEEDARDYESNLQTAQGDQIPIQVTVHTIQIDDKQRLQWIFRDITERKELDQLRDDLTSMIYHDLRAPLANVISSLDVLSATVAVDAKPEVRSLFDIATRSTKRIQRLTKSLLDINRLEAGQPVIEPKPVVPTLITENALKALKPVAKNKQQTVHIQVPDDLPPVLVDGDMIERVVINLLQNAIKYTPQQGEIELGAVRVEDTIKFWVKDNGPGIAPQAKDTIFEKFTRLHAEEGPKGLGLGLAFCRLAVEGHGGKIWVDNLPEGGSQFSFTLPIAPPEDVESTQPITLPD
jgi:PAS domain S-box-containing protein